MSKTAEKTAKATPIEDQQYIIDVDIVIDLYNKANPDLLPMDRTRLAKELGVNKQTFVDWKAGKTPALVARLIKLMVLGNCRITDFCKNA